MNLDDLGIAPTVLPDVTTPPGPAPETVALARQTKRLEASLRRLIKAADATGSENAALRSEVGARRLEVRVLLFVSVGALVLGLLAVAVAIR